MLTPLERVIGVAAGLAVFWGMFQWGVPAFPDIIAGLFTWATITGQYRRRRAAAGRSHPNGAGR